MAEQDRKFRRAEFIQDAAQVAAADIHALCRGDLGRRTAIEAAIFAALAQKLADVEQANRMAADDLAQMTARAEMAEKELAEAREQLERAKLAAAWGEKLRG